VIGPDVGRLVRATIDNAASARGGGTFAVDPAVPTSRLVSVLVERAAMRARGVVRLPSAPGVSIGRGVRLRTKGRISAGRGVTVASGATIDALSVDGVVLGAGTTVGRGTRIEGTGSLRTLGRGLTVGERVGLGTDSFYGCAGGITIGDDTIIGNMVTFHSENHVTARLDVPIRDQGVSHAGIRVGAGCWIGAKATILDGADIGDGVVVAAGAVLPAGRYEDNSVYGGVPARLIAVRTAQ
jgi:carbonic anhydrase/acetyltransferase-like protein (isoleucine patch superfamily)